MIDSIIRNRVLVDTRPLKKVIKKFASFKSALESGNHDQRYMSYACSIPDDCYETRVSLNFNMHFG